MQKVRVEMKQNEYRSNKDDNQNSGNEINKKEERKKKKGIFFQ